MQVYIDTLELKHAKSLELRSHKSFKNGPKLVFQKLRVVTIFALQSVFAWLIFMPK